MFTGIVEGIGTVGEVRDDEGGRRIGIETSFEDLTEGQSIAVDGACLTVEAVTAEGFELFCSTETLERTTQGDLVAGDPVNLERAMPADGRFDGHLVQGHIDGTAELLDIEAIEDDWTFSFEMPDALDRYVVEKGSIAIDGISLTVAERSVDSFSVAIIPETYERTTFGTATPGDRVNLEVDVIAKYVESMLG